LERHGCFQFAAAKNLHESFVNPTPVPLTDEDFALLPQAVKQCLTLLGVDGGLTVAESVGFTRTREDVESFWRQFVTHAQIHGEAKIDDTGLVEEIVRLALAMNAQTALDVPGAKHTARQLKALLTKLESYRE
jgi:hypothetical protein